MQSKDIYAGSASVELVDDEEKGGVFLPPSPYESCFISTAHDEAALEKTVRVLCDALGKIAY